MTLDRRLSLSAIAIGLLLRLYVGFTAEGYYFPDEVFQYLEPGHLIAFGRANMCWEYEYGMRSWLLPGLLGGIMRTFDLLGIHHTDDYWRIFRILAAVLSLVMVVAADRLGRRIGGPWVGVAAAFLTAVYVPLLDLAPRVLVDSISGALGVWALARIFDDDATESDYALSGALFALAAVLRLASGVAIVPPFLVLLARKDWRRFTVFCGAIALVFLFSGALDWVTWGRPFNSWIAYVEMNFIRGAAAKFGTSPNDAYLVMILRTFDWLYPAALGAIVFGFRKSGRVGATVLLTFLFMSAVGHKEFRFTAGILPLLMVLLANGVFVLAERITAERLRRIAVLGALSLFAAQNLNEVHDQEWGEGNAEQRAVAHVQRMNDVHGVFVSAGRWFAGGELMMHRNVPSMYLVSKESVPKDYMNGAQSPLLDVYVLDEHGLAGLRGAGLNPEELRAVEKVGPWTIYRRTPSAFATAVKLQPEPESP